MGVELSSAILRHLSRVRENPARAVDPAELEELERYTREDMKDRFLALMSPEANYTWTSRVLLETSKDESPLDSIEDFGQPVEVVGLLPLILAVEANKTAPPIEAIDVQINVDRGAKEFRTASNTPVTSQQVPTFAPLASVSAAIANRIMRLRLGENGQIATMGFTYRWTVDSATRAALSWSNVQVSCGVFYALCGDYPRGRRK